MKYKLTRSSDKLNQIIDGYVLDRIREKGAETIALEREDKLIATASIYQDGTCDFYRMSLLTNQEKISFLKAIKRDLKSRSGIAAYVQKESKVNNRFAQWLGFKLDKQIQGYNFYIW